MNVKKSGEYEVVSVSVQTTYHNVILQATH